MALTIVPLYKWTLHNTSSFISLIQVTGDTAYPNTGGTIGYPITPSMFGLTSFADTSDVGQTVPTLGYHQGANVAPAGAPGGFTKIDATTANLRFFGPTGTEIANAATAAGIGAILIAFGR